MFRVRHEHGAGDRCISFRHAPDYFESLAAAAGVRNAKPRFRMLRLPPLRSFSALVARACAGLAGATDLPWEEISVQVAAETVQLAGGLARDSRSAPPSAVARVTRAVRMIERHPDTGLSLGSLARGAGPSPCHFLRTFERLTGVTPHRYVRRRRLREAAMRLSMGPARVIDIALDCGFGDVSNLNHAFRAEFGVSPRVFRRQAERLQRGPSRFHGELP